MNKVKITLVSLVMIWGLSGCTLYDSFAEGIQNEHNKTFQKDGNSGQSDLNAEGVITDEEIAVQNTEDITFYNEVLGVKYTVPKGWWIYSISEDNLNTDPMLTNDASRLATYVYDDGLTGMELFDIANVKDSEADHCINVFAVADTAGKPLTMEEYLAIITKEINFDETTATVQEGIRNINGVEFYRLQYKITEDAYPYFIDYYIVANGDYFITTHFVYWEGNQSADTEIEKYLTNYFNLNTKK